MESKSDKEEEIENSEKEQNISNDEIKINSHEDNSIEILTPSSKYKNFFSYKKK